MFSLATWLVYQEARSERWLIKSCWAGLALLLVQSVFGGLTVLYRLPDLVSTTHLGLAFGFLALATSLAAATSRVGVATSAPGAGTGTRNAGLARWAAVVAFLVFAQSVLGALVRHMDAGMACPDAPLCLGQVVPPLINAPIISHFSHRVLAIIVAVAVLALALRVRRQESDATLRTLAGLAAALVLAQVALGVASVLTVLAVVPVSLHTLVAAALLSSLVWLAMLAHPMRETEPGPAAVAAAAA
jgi:heme A synthase